jgi:hypothetical protein
VDGTDSVFVCSGTSVMYSESFSRDLGFVHSMGYKLPISIKTTVA